MIQIDQSRCIGCGMCVYDCFPGALTMDGRNPALSAPGSCIGCGHCIAVCPRGAVSDDQLNMALCREIEKTVAGEALLGLMRSRRSCRHYRDMPVPEETLEALLEAARACPTAMNLQGTRYIAVKDRIGDLLDLALDTLGEIGLRQRETAQDPGEKRRAENFIRWQKARKEDRTFDPLFFHAPLLLVFVSDRSAILDAAAAAAYTELLAASMGLGCLYSGYFTACCGLSPEIRKLLSVKDQEQVARCLVLGYPDITFQRTAPRKAPNVTYL